MKMENFNFMLVEDPFDKVSGGIGLSPQEYIGDGAINLFNESKRDEESMDYKEIRRSKGNKSVTTESNTETYNDLNENKFNDKKERKKMSYVERRKLFRSKFEENEK